MKEDTKALIGSLCFAACQAVGPVAWGFSFADGDRFTKGALALYAALWTVDRAMRLWSKPAKKETLADALTATINGEPFDPAETAELMALLKRAHERRQRPKPDMN